MPLTAPSGQPNQANPSYDWPRFWIPQTDILDLSDAGFLQDPEDILVNAFRHGADGEVLDAIAAVIEVKGCWNDEVFTGIEGQLVNDYMVNLGAPVGIFLVGWFDKTDWDPADYRRRTTPASLSSEVQRELDQQAAAVPEGLRVRAIVLDIRAPVT